MKTGFLKWRLQLYDPIGPKNQVEQIWPYGMSIDGEFDADFVSYKNLSLNMNRFSDKCNFLGGYVFNFPFI